MSSQSSASGGVPPSLSIVLPSTPVGGVAPPPPYSPCSPTTLTPGKLKRMGSVKKQPFFMNLRIQLVDQLKSLDTRLETQVQLTNEIQEFFKKRAEVEMETSRALEKLARNLNTRHKELKAKRDSTSAPSSSSTPLSSSSASSTLQPWTVFNSQSSLSVCWQQLINDTKIQSQNHATLSEIYSTEITQRLSYVSEDIQRIYKQCREIGLEAHEELLKVLHELHTSMKTYHTYQTETRVAEAKLKLVEAQRAKLETQIPKEKLEKSKKLKLVEKEVQKRTHKFTDARFKSQKAKNEYILCMDAANAAVQKYFMEDLSDLIDCMDLGFYECVTRCFNMYVSSQDQIRKSLTTNMENMSKCVSSLDARLDKQKFLESHNSVFALPKKFEFVFPTYPNNKNTASIAEEDFTPDPSEIETSGFIRQELEQRVYQLHKRLDTLRMESDELWKTLETAENSLLEMITAKDYDTCSFFIERGNRNESGRDKMRSDKQETDEFHLNKFRDYMLTMNRISRLQAKYDHIRRTLKTSDPGLSIPLSSNAAQLAASTRAYNRRKRIGQIQKFTNTRLFGGSIEEYLEKTNQEIPCIMKSCIRVINLYGLQHQGIFRVSGSQVEINNFKEAFEKGEDPLADVNDASDINSVAGVFKLYLRELREPLFPICYFEQFMELAQLENPTNFITRMRDLVRSLPKPVFVVLRYLFAFLNHLSEYSDENMMDPYNLAICFGPTLVPVPEDKDQVQYQNLVNELIKNVILHHDEIFIEHSDGVRYEKYMGADDHELMLSRDSPATQRKPSTTLHSREDSNCSSTLEHARGCSEEVSDPICTSPLPNPPVSPVIRETVIINDDDEEYENDDAFESLQSDFLEAIAQFDFNARSPRELSLKKGETLVLYAQVSSDWWKGANRKGDEGLIPDKYIVLRIRDDDTGPSTHTPVQRSSTPCSTNSIPPPLTTPPISNTQTSTPTSRARTQSDSLINNPITPTPQHQESTNTHVHSRSYSVSAADEARTATENGNEEIGSLPNKKQLTRSTTVPSSSAPPTSASIQPTSSSTTNDVQQNVIKTSSTTSSTPSPSPSVKSNPLIQAWESRVSKPTSATTTSAAAPDLVLDLPSSQSSDKAPTSTPSQPITTSNSTQQQQQPVVPNFTDTSPSSSDSDSSSSSTSTSPTTPRGSNAEVFAKQKNATLKKRTPDSNWTSPQPPTLFTFNPTFNKPQVKVKPVVLSKPKLPQQFSSSLNKMDEDSAAEEHEPSEKKEQNNSSE